MKKSVLTYIAEYIHNRDITFVFPSAIPALFWAEASAVRLGIPLGIDRFTAWDIFKAETLSVRQKNQHAANSAVRTVFAGNLLKQNKESQGRGDGLFQELISPAYADNYESFIPSISRMLPQLDTFARHLEDRPDLSVPYFEDIRKIHEKYRAFLGNHGFYEAAWNRAPFNSRGKTWLLFFPELADDWKEYEQELADMALGGSGSIIIVPLEELSGACPLSAGQEQLLPGIQEILGSYQEKQVIFSSIKDEFLWLALTIRNLLDAGAAPGDIAISVPGLPENFERLALEFRMRDVPVSIRQGKPLSSHTGGRIFAALGNCSSSRWSYAALKSLLMDKSLPWKDEAVIDELMEFGLKYRCMSGYRDQGREVDVWERSFDRAADPDTDKAVPLDAIKTFYHELKQDITKITGAGNFSGIKNAWLQFEEKYLIKELIHGDVDKVMARVIRALDELIDAEEKLGNSMLEKPYLVFQNYIREIEYVFQPGTGGVPVYNYRAAAGISPLVHFIINMNQDDATAKGNSISFLREDRLGILGLSDQDLSSHFVRAYKLSGFFPVFSASRQTLTGPAIPHRMLTEHLARGELALDDSLLRGLGDPYRTELDVARGTGSSGDPSWAGPTGMQRRAYSYYHTLAMEPFQDDIRDRPLADRDLIDILQLKLSDKKGDRRISPSDINEFLKCPFRWMLQSGLKVREKQTEIETIDQRDLGTLYHRILERFFNRIKAEHTRFRAEDLPRYMEYIREETGTALEEARLKEGAFQAPVFEMLRERILSALSQYLDLDAETLNGCSVVGPEQPLRREFENIPIALAGISDLVMRDDEGNTILTDFKTGVMPSTGELRAENPGEEPLNIQIAAYISMIEKFGRTKVRTARFYSLDNRTFKEVVSEKKPSKSNLKLPVTREEYQKEVEDAERAFRRLAEKMDAGEFMVPPPNKRLFCNECRVSSVCRIPYSGGDI